MQPVAYLYGTLSVGAVAVSTFAPPAQRRAAWICSAMLTGSWLFTIMSFTRWNVPLLLERYGIDVTSVSLWSSINVTIAIVVLFVATPRFFSPIWTMGGKPYWWGNVLVALLMMACFNDYRYWLDPRVANWRGFSRWADILFCAEESLFFAIGGRGLINAANRLGHRIAGYLGGSMGPVRAKAALLSHIW
jgi:hypothetical protein